MHRLKHMIHTHVYVLLPLDNKENVFVLQIRKRGVFVGSADACGVGPNNKQ